MTLMPASAMPASQIVNPQIDVAGQFQQGRQDAAVNTSNDQTNRAQMIEILAHGAASAMPQGPNGPVDPEKWNAVMDTFEQTGMPPDKVKAFRDHPELAPILLKGSATALKNQYDAASFDQSLKLLDAQIAQTISAAAKNEAGPVPTDDQRELAQINAERKTAGTPVLSMEEYQAAKKSNSGFSVTTNPDGTVSVVQGAKPLTEGQSKDMVYVTRASGALPIVDALGDKLLSLGENVAGKLPYGEYLQSDDYQKADQAGREFLAAVLRKDTGAAVTPSEMSVYGKTYLPQPGDKPGNLAQKKAARARAVKAIEMGLPPQAILSLEGENVDVPDLPGGPTDAPSEATGAPKTAKETKVIDGVTYENRGGGPDDWYAVD